MAPVGVLFAVSVIVFISPPPTTAASAQNQVLCQVYTGETCAGYLYNQTVFVAPELTIEIIEERLKSAYGVIKESK